MLRRDDQVAGYGGLWRVGLEAHITTIGVRREDQGKGFGTVLFCALISRAYELRARWMTLEVRTSNRVAVGMYEAFGFKAIGRRRGYYTDNGEDAVIMWSDSIHAPRFKNAFTERLAGVAISGVGDAPPQEYPR